MGLKRWWRKLRADEDAEEIRHAEQVSQAKEGERWLADEDPVERAIDQTITRGGGANPNPYD
jgi:hypothetical protein